MNYPGGFDVEFLPPVDTIPKTDELLKEMGIISISTMGMMISLRHQGIENTEGIPLTKKQEVEFNKLLNSDSEEAVIYALKLSKVCGRRMKMRERKAKIEQINGIST